MRHYRRRKEVYSFNGKQNIVERLKHLSSQYLQGFVEHKSGSGTKYYTIGDFVIRVSNHLETSSQYPEPNLNIVNRKLEEEDYLEVEKQITYPKYCKQLVFSKYVGLTIPKLKKLLPECCYDKIIENEKYYNTYTTVIRVRESLEHLSSLGINIYTPIRQEVKSFEDFRGNLQL